MAIRQVTAQALTKRRLYTVHLQNGAYAASEHIWMSPDYASYGQVRCMTFYPSYSPVERSERPVKVNSIGQTINGLVEVKLNENF